MMDMMDDLDDEPFSEIVIEYDGVQATLRTPQPYWARPYQRWICSHPGVRAVIELATEEVFDEGLCSLSERGLPNWAVDVGRLVAKRLGAKIIREKTFNMEEYLRTHPPLEDDPLVEA